MIGFSEFIIFSVMACLLGVSFAKMRKLERELLKIKKEYFSLIMAVSRKHPNESRYETALRYILERENICETSSKQEDS